MTGVGTSLTDAFDHVWERLMARLEGLGEDEYLWQPVPGCWSIHQADDGTWRLDGPGSGQPPDPPPITTIAWRIGHLAGLAVGGFADWLFGNETPGAADIAVPGNAAEVAEFCERNYRRWHDGMIEMSEEDWWQPLGPKWGPYADSNAVDLALHVLDETIHHGAEVGLLRDLYLRRTQLG